MNIFVYIHIVLKFCCQEFLNIEVGIATLDTFVFLVLKYCWHEVLSIEVEVKNLDTFVFFVVPLKCLGNHTSLFSTVTIS